MLKNSLLFVLFAFLMYPPSSYAQKAKDKRVDIKYVSLPTEKLPADFNTYSVSVYGANIAVAGLSEASLENDISMYSFKRVGTSVEGEFGHLRVSVNTGSVSTGRMSMKSRTENKKNDKGEEYKVTYYWYELPCSGISSYKIIDPEGNILDTYSQTWNTPSKSDETTSSSSLSDKADQLRTSMRKNYAADMARTAVNGARNTLRTKYDFAHVSDDPQFYSIKKHAEEDAFEASLEKTIEVFKALPATAPASEGLTKLEGPIKLWSKYSETAPGKDKDLQEVYIACNSNLANAYFYLDKFDDAAKHAKRVLAVDEKEKRMERLLEKMAKVKTQMNFHGISTMHYTRDLSNALPPSKVKAFEEAKEELAADNNSLSGYLVMGADTVRGMFMRSKADEDFVFGPNGNTKFMIEKAGALEEKDITAAQVKGFVIGDRTFSRMMFSPSAKGKSEAALHILEELYGSEKIKLFKYYPITGTLSGAQTEYAFMKKDATAPVSLMDTQFLLWDKGLTNYFGDCADLKDMCAAGGFKMNEDDLIKAARVYAEVCQ